jgi:hypothetical protein
MKLVGCIDMDGQTVISQICCTKLSFNLGRIDNFRFIEAASNNDGDVFLKIVALPCAKAFRSMPKEKQLSLINEGHVHIWLKRCPFCGTEITQLGKIQNLSKRMIGEQNAK